ncbi:M55 family metallopeptidase [Kribbella solani]|uniref:M55 family metallopeptidase n=1 Tax=Kribbella solani TaxID=236067 RepID=UPI0029A7A4D9|nr:M55 family metallopeptidase [Kribbella solani]MDX2968108.1 M55 family metallopeptidase [Kribbella solani]
MRVYISIDMEGIAGVTTADQAYRGGHNYPRAQQLITAEANSAIAGAFDGGATEVLINDAHGTMDNLLPDELDERATLLLGRPKPQCMMQGLESGHDVAMLLGYHPAANEPGIFSHTLSECFARYLINGETASEADVAILQAAALGVPVGLVTGDDQICQWVEKRYPGIATASVKQSVGQLSAVNLHPRRACELIRTTAGDTVRRLGTFQVPPVPEQLHLQVTLQQPAHTEIVAMIPGVRRLDRLTVEADLATPDDLVALTTVMWELTP